jgi:predicted Fe-Mo cluster-binding NifX family protein
MKIAIASTAETLDGEISSQGGRAPFYLFLNENSELIHTFKNPFSTGGGGAGNGVAKILEDEGISKVIVGKVGGNMKEALEEAHIELVEREGSITDFLKEIK